MGILTEKDDATRTAWANVQESEACSWSNGHSPQPTPATKATSRSTKMDTAHQARMSGSKRALLELWLSEWHVLVAEPSFSVARRQLEQVFVAGDAEEGPNILMSAAAAGRFMTVGFRVDLRAGVKVVRAWVHGAGSLLPCDDGRKKQTHGGPLLLL